MLNSWKFRKKLIGSELPKEWYDVPFTIPYVQQKKNIPVAAD